MTIGQAAQAAGLTRKAIRIYEAKGLLPTAKRTAAGYRLYSADDVELLTFIRRARALGLRLEDVGEVLRIRRGGTPPCDAVRNLLDARIAEIDATISDLLALRQSLTETRRAADNRTCGEPAAVCSIIEDA
ncbi:heavy metal-responsive transcriptional regulator [Streptomyces cellulosae]|uniref:Heavy metal-responsive transcriptional regulator n=1 Tax=Streptomyces cellulosae TaxID=1968 RepID=A0ABW6JVL5_STRCE